MEEAWLRDLLGTNRPAEPRVPLEHADFPALLREQRRGDERVDPAADRDRVVAPHASASRLSTERRASSSVGSVHNESSNAYPNVLSSDISSTSYQPSQPAASSPRTAARDPSPGSAGRTPNASALGGRRRGHRRSSRRGRPPRDARCRTGSRPPRRRSARARGRSCARTRARRPARGESAPGRRERSVPRTGLADAPNALTHDLGVLARPGQEEDATGLELREARNGRADGLHAGLGLVRAGDQRRGQDRPGRRQARRRRQAALAQLSAHVGDAVELEFEDSRSRPRRRARYAASSSANEAGNVVHSQIPIRTPAT